MIFIKKLTASSSGTLDFLNGSSDVVFDSTYKEYIFTYKNIHPETDGTRFQFQVDTGTNTSYNQTITSTSFYAYHAEGGGSQGLSYDGTYDQAQGTGFQELEQQLGNGNDESCSGHLHLFNPSSTTFVKHFIARVNAYQGENYTVDNYTAGYANTTSAVNAVQFKMSSGNIDAGDICLYGIL
jgi:hypothetical protein